MSLVLIALGVVCVVAAFVMVAANKANDKAGGSGLGKFSIEGPAWLVLLVVGLAATGWGSHRWETNHPPKTVQDRETVTDVPATDPPVIDDTAFPNGYTFGDNNQLDKLWRECERSQWDSCDQLYLESDLDSDYEWFGATCGDLPFNPNPDTEWCDPTTEG